MIALNHLCQLVKHMRMFEEWIYSEKLLEENKRIMALLRQVEKQIRDLMDYFESLQGMSLRHSQG